ncbi:MAG: magnesium and cobalt transporter [Candidatus Azotimanducaceae bacterium]|jgi:magnesium and cobalt transporter|tara:strand:- start:6534 stop:7418 length:885 start_codon:yes stop_codon:yes gene_type:complete
MSDMSEFSDDSVDKKSPRRGVRGWLSDLFSEAPDDVAALLEVLHDAAERQLIDVDALNIIVGALHVADMHARDIMIPRSALVVVHEDQQPAELLPLVIDSKHSRFPVVGDDVDDIKGILHAKDLLSLVLEEGGQRFDIKDFIRPAAVIPESKRLNVLLEEFRANRNHMALVVDEYGQISGAVTIEDVLEQIVGEIEDEHDVDDDSFVKQLEPSSFHVKANTTIEDFNEYFSLTLSDDEFDTIGGIVLQAFGHLPELGECIEVAGLKFEVLNADSRRLRLLRVDTPEPIEHSELA